ncbi:hypothetical protein J2W56_006639 [Nocardia kruczakiae]|uniref:Outer membrane protein with glycine zipper n=1 Tax=Nocardia kruczakiae TaxID=261477 RepID=A0ABU1XQN5_9NOCA|nr:hypothetical protein [Nocardia kruczakiae]MDR7172873.1 hypothetical protein [Nocardia kruczakiae]
MPRNRSNFDIAACSERTARPGGFVHRTVRRRGVALGGQALVVGAVHALVLLTTPDATATIAPIVGQPGVTTPVQPGTVTPPPPAPPVAPSYTEQPAAVRNGAVPRPAPSPDPVEPVKVEELHAPVPVAPVAPIAPPVDEIRVGQFAVPSPPWVPGEVRDAINDTAATAEAQVATALDSIGIPPGRSDRVSGATLAGAGIGGAVGATITAAPAAAAGAAVGGLVGGTIGGIAGAAVGTLVTVPVIGTVTSGVAGTVIGAAAGAAAGAIIAGAPAAVVGAVVGGTVGAGFGAAVGVDQR